MKIKKVVIPVAGFGTRFLPATKCIPKEMFPIVDKPVIQYLVEEAVDSGVKEVIFVTAKDKTALEDHFDSAAHLSDLLQAQGKTELRDALIRLETMVSVTSVRQKRRLGLGHAIWCARDAVGNEPFAVILGDEMVLAPRPALGQMVEAAARLKGSIVAVAEVPWDRTHRYGIVDGEQVEPRARRLTKLIEKPAQGLAPTNLAITGRYLLHPRIFEILGRTDPGSNGEIQLTDALAVLARDPATPVYSYAFEGERFDAGSQLGFIEANLRYGLEQPKMREPLMNYMRELLGKE